MIIKLINQSFYLVSLKRFQLFGQNYPEMKWRVQLVKLYSTWNFTWFVSSRISIVAFTEGLLAFFNNKLFWYFC